LSVPFEVHFTSLPVGSLLLPYAWGNESEADILHVDQQQMKARQNAVCRIAGMIITNCA
jgi:hypothetical protein